MPTKALIQVFCLSFLRLLHARLKYRKGQIAQQRTRALRPPLPSKTAAMQKTTITTMLRIHFATSQLCLANPHEVRTPYSTAVAIRNGIHGTMIANETLQWQQVRRGLPVLAPRRRCGSERIERQIHQARQMQQKKMNKINGCFTVRLALGSSMITDRPPPTRLSPMAPVQRRSHS